MTIDEKQCICLARNFLKNLEDITKFTINESNTKVFVDSIKDLQNSLEKINHYCKINITLELISK